MADVKEGRGGKQQRRGIIVLLTWLSQVLPYLEQREKGLLASTCNRVRRELNKPQHWPSVSLNYKRLGISQTRSGRVSRNSRPAGLFVYCKALLSTPRFSSLQAVNLDRLNLGSTREPQLLEDLAKCKVLRRLGLPRCYLDDVAGADNGLVLEKHVVRLFPNLEGLAMDVSKYTPSLKWGKLILGGLQNLRDLYIRAANTHVFLGCLIDIGPAPALALERLYFSGLQGMQSHRATTRWSYVPAILRSCQALKSIGFINCTEGHSKKKFICSSADYDFSTDGELGNVPPQIFSAITLAAGHELLQEEQEMDRIMCNFILSEHTDVCKQLTAVCTCWVL
jgi:hypothetical protein